MRKQSAQSMQLKDEMAKDIGVYETVRQNGIEGKKCPFGEKESNDRCDESAGETPS